MDYERLFAIADRSRAKQRLSADDEFFVGHSLPTDLESFPRVDLPKSVWHPGGFSVSGAPVGSFLRAALLLAGQKVFGSRYAGSAFFERVESDFALAIMRSNFHREFPKGAHCCIQCTLAVLPVYDANAIRYFDCEPLARNVRRMIDAGEWRFSSTPNAKMLKWSLGKAAT